MKRILLCAAVFLSAATVSVFAQYKEKTAYSDLYDSETVSALKAHVSYLASEEMKGRAAGSSGEKAAALYLGNIFSKYGVDLLSVKDGDLFGIKKADGDTLTSRNVIGFIQGNDKKLRSHYVVIGARLDNLGENTLTVDGKVRDRIYYGANGNASGVAILAELARMLSTNSALIGRSVLLIGFGASQNSFAGSWYFLNRAFSDVGNIDAMIDLDMLGTGDSGFYAYTSSNADMNGIINSLSGTLQPVKPEIITQEPFPSDHRTFYAKKIPSVLFTTGKYPEYDTEKDVPSILDYDMMEDELEYIYNFSISLLNGSGPMFDPSAVKKQRYVSEKNVYGYFDCDQRPEFLGSADPTAFMKKWVYHYLKYPQEAVRNGIQGRVLVDFIIDKNGDVKNAKVVRSVDPLLDAEALRVVNASPRWRPGRVLGKKVDAEMTITIEFKLTKEKTFGIKK
ncbi:MAG: TonB family protein [Bacteroidales bacterium]|jgi:TonB family protein|nr:TonB family protein [Bacteroidales bacterium]